MSSIASKIAGAAKKLVAQDTAATEVAQAPAKVVKSMTSLARKLAPPETRQVYYPNYVFTMIRSTKDLGPNKTVFRVPMKMNKIMIANYLEEIYKVNVTKVNTMVYLGKTKYLDQSRRRTFKKPDWKKAIVTTAEEFSMPEFKPVKIQREPVIKKSEEASS